MQPAPGRRSLQGPLGRSLQQVRSPVPCWLPAGNDQRWAQAPSRQAGCKTMPEWQGQLQAAQAAASRPCVRSWL